MEEKQNKKQNEKPKKVKIRIKKNKKVNQNSENKKIAGPKTKDFTVPISAKKYIYDEEKEGKKFDELQDDWECPVCGIEKSDFIKL